MLVWQSSVIFLTFLINRVALFATAILLVLTGAGSNTTGDGALYL